MFLSSENWKYNVVSLFIGIITIFYLFVKRIYTYWDRKDIKSLPDASFFFGHFSTTFTQKESLGDLITRIYKNSSEPFLGIYSIFRPILLVCDPQLARTILVKDFQHFTDRGIHCNEGYDPLSGHLFALPGQKWKNLRGKLSPTFTSGKLKSMFSTLVDCGNSLEDFLEKLRNKGDLLDVREISASHATNVIASVAFGIDVDTIHNPMNAFRVCGRKIFESSFSNSVRLSLSFIAPKLMSVFRIKSVDQSVETFIKSVVEQNLDYREKNNIVRKDFFQLLVQLRNSGSVKLDDEWETVIQADEGQKTLTVNEIAAQTFVFFAAGFETSSTTLTFCMYELARNQDIQDQVLNEIDSVLERHGGKITYESISKMKYLDACIDETLRKYAIVPLLNRTCVKDYQIPGTKKIIEKGVEIFIPAYAFQTDAKYYDEPEKFKPTRFSDESSAAKNSANRPYLPFGDGPRNCIGMRMGKMQTKVALVLMLRKFRYELEPKLMNRDMIFDPKLFLLAPKDPVKLQIIGR